MSRSHSPGAETLGEVARLEQAHHDVRTALTVISSNVELLRIQVRDMEDAKRVVVHARLDDIDLAQERLVRVAMDLRAWHKDASGRGE